MIMCVKRIDFEDQSNSVALSSQRPGQSELRNPDVGPNFVADQIWILWLAAMNYHLSSSEPLSCRHVKLAADLAVYDCPYLTYLQV